MVVTTDVILARATQDIFHSRKLDLFVNLVRPIQSSKPLQFVLGAQCWVVSGFEACCLLQAWRA